MSLQVSIPTTTAAKRHSEVDLPGSDRVHVVVVIRRTPEDGSGVSDAVAAAFDGVVLDGRAARGCLRCRDLAALHI